MPLLVDSASLSAFMAPKVQAPQGGDLAEPRHNVNGRGQGGRGVAFRWRIRHKLILGLILVVGILALLLGGTIKGLASYHATMKAMRCKMAELKEANELRVKVATLKSMTEKANSSQSWAFRKQVDEVRQSLLACQENHVRNAAFEGDDAVQIPALLEHAGKLKEAIERAIENQRQLLSDDKVIAEIDILAATLGDLILAINSNSYDRIHKADSDYKTSLAIVLSTAIVGILLTASLLRFFYRWVFYPIRDLQQGAGRVAQGDFEHRIEVQSGDEMEDLAAAFNDMTGRLREMYRDLARQVNERSRQLVRSERLAGIGFLAAGVAHEINNPLASIAFCSEALEGRLAELLSQATGKQLPAQDRQTVTKYLKMIQQESFRCKEITQRLLEFSRGGERRREATDLAQLVQGVLDMVQHLQNCRGKKLIFHPVGPITAWVNGQEIKSVVLNLVVNALDSMDDGGTLRITLSQRDRMAELVFTDTGCGMTSEVLENIFEPFFTRSRTGKGTGLGLSISHRIINQHGGEIEAASPGLNQGTTFTVRLPLEPVEEQRVENAEQRPESMPSESEAGVPTAGKARRLAA
jgi:signal transduction histidine kinase